MYYPEIKWQLLSTMAKDKNYNKFYRILSKISNSAVITSGSIYKESDPEKVYLSCKKFIKKAIFYKDFNEAFNFVINTKKPLLITGSFYLSGPFLEKYKNYKQI